jgi:membrane protease YdiL (CAAX protease family)
MSGFETIMAKIFSFANNEQSKSSILILSTNNLALESPHSYEPESLLPEENNSPFREGPPPILLFILIFGSAAIGALVGSLLAGGVALAFGYDLQSFISGFSETDTLADRNLVRLITLVNHTFTFLIPAIFVAWYFYRKEWFTFLKIGKSPAFQNAMLATVLIIVAFPFAQLTYWINAQVPLPDALSSIEDSTAGLIKGLLVMNGPMELLFNLLIIAVLPAIGEELIFRGLIQQTLEKWMQNPIKAIWVAAFIFSFIHFQFEGFLPRMVLGAVLGYLFYWTKNLWIPILAHGVNNGVQVLAAYWYPEKMNELEPESMGSSIWISGVISFGLILILARYIKKVNTGENPV